MKAIKIFFVLGALIMTSCAKDACKDTICNNGGVCDDGTCICAAWYEGTNCNSEQRAKYYGVYVGEVEIYNQGNVVATGTWLMTVTPGQKVYELDIEDVTYPLTTSGSGNFSRSYEAESGGINYNIVESGFFSGNLLEFRMHSNGNLEYKFIGYK